MSNNDWKPTREIPDCEVTIEARNYLKAAYLCLDNDLPWTSGVNAAFSIELFLKAYLIEEHRASGRKRVSKSISRGHGKRNSGHQLTALYQSIPESVKDKIQDNALVRLPDFMSLLERSDGVFENARYPYERDHAHKNMMRNSELLGLAQFFNDIAEEIWCPNPVRMKYELEVNNG